MRALGAGASFLGYVTNERAGITHTRGSQDFILVHGTNRSPLRDASPRCASTHSLPALVILDIGSTDVMRRHKCYVNARGGGYENQQLNSHPMPPAKARSAAGDDWHAWSSQPEIAGISLVCTTHPLH